MKYEESKKLSEENFRRLTGVKRVTFEKMVEILNIAEAARRKRGGHKSKLSVETMLLMTLEYLREYRTYFHIAQSYGVHESTAIRVSRWVENTLIKDGTFSLSGKKALLQSDTEYEIILIDATETPVERPKRGRKNTIQERKEDIP